jgi:predicted RND superfamily exporter protein
MSLVAMLCRKSLRSFSTVLIRVCRLSWKNPKVALLLSLLLTLVFFRGVGKLSYIFSVQDMVDEGIPSADELRPMRARYEDGTSSSLIVEPPEGKESFSVQELCAIRKWYSILRTTEPSIKNSTSCFDVKWPVSVPNDRVKYQNILQLDCNALKIFRPIGETVRLFNESPWAALKDSKNRMSLIFNFTYREVENSKFGSFDPKMVEPSHVSAEKDLQPLVPGAKLHWVGMADYQYYMKKGFEFAIFVNLSMITLLILSLRFVYGTWKAGLIFCTTVMVNGIWVYGGKGLFHSPYDVLSASIFLLLGISAIEDFTFLSSMQLKGATWRKAVRTLIVPSFFTSFTTFVGFISLLTSELGVIRRFGTWCALGAMIEWFLLFAILPAFLCLFPKCERWTSAEKGHASLFENIKIFSFPRGVSRALLIVFPFALLTFQHLVANDTPSAAFPAKHPYNQGLQALKEIKGWQASLSLVLAPTSEAAPTSYAESKASYEKLEDFSLRLQKAPEIEGNITSFESPKRAMEWIGGTGLLPPETLFQDFKTSLQYKQMVDPDGVPRATLYIQDMSVRALQLIKEAAEKICPHGECHVAGDLVAYSDFSTLVPKTLTDSIVLSVLLVFAIIAYLALAFGQPRVLWALLASSFWGPCAILASMVLLHVSMDFMKSIIASILIGLTGDNAIQFLFAARTGEFEGGILKRAGASILTNTLMAMVSLVYLMSYFEPPKTFGLFLAAGLIAALVGDLGVLKGLISKRTHREPQA